MSTVLIAAAGLLVLLWLAVLIGASMDTEARRREWRRVASARRARWEGRQALARTCPRADCPLRR